MNISRNANRYDYKPNSHAGNRKRERRIPLEAVDSAIENGNAKEGKKGRINFEAKWSGATFTVVANPKTNYIVTAFWGTSKTGKALEEAHQSDKTAKSPYRSAWR